MTATAPQNLLSRNKSAPDTLSSFANSSPSLSIANSTPTNSTQSGFPTSIRGAGSYDILSLSPDRRYVDANASVLPPSLTLPSAARRASLSRAALSAHHAGEKIEGHDDDRSNNSLNTDGEREGGNGSSRIATHPATTTTTTTKLVCIPNVTSYSCLPRHNTTDHYHFTSASAPRSCPKSLTYRGAQSYADFSCPTTQPSACFVPPTASMMPIGVYRRFAFKGQMRMVNPYANYPLPASMRQEGAAKEKREEEAKEMTNVCGPHKNSLPTTSRSASAQPVYACASKPVKLAGDAENKDRSNNDKNCSSPVILCPTADASLKLFEEQRTGVRSQHADLWSSVPQTFTNNAMCGTSWHVSRRSVEDLIDQ